MLDKVLGIVFDMDGVLAEVSRSYRTAIVRTAQKFGATVTFEDIEAEKRAGNANNDWALTHRMIQSNGIEVCLEEVTSVFEELYQGDKEKDGLHLLETLIPSRGVLEELHRRVDGKFAIVTGRPRRDCLNFLERYNLGYLFKTCVCMEDASPKPDPAPVLLAITRLELPAASCLMLGDTPDDILSAVRAGAVGIGVLTPHQYAKSILNGKPCSMVEALSGCGAAQTVRPGLADLLDIVPTASFAESTTELETVADATHREARLSRQTAETDITVAIDLDGTGKSKVTTGLGFLDHMLMSFSKHSRFDLVLRCVGDLHVDDHHSVEDTAISLGCVFDKALGPRKGIRRFGHKMAPLDEALSRAVVDISSRPGADVNLQLKREKIGTVSTEMLEHFIESFAQGARVTIHVDVLKGKNDHHKAESAFKAMAMALRQAVEYDSTAGVPSTKAYLE